MTVKRWIFLITGLISLGLGSVGIGVPMLPTVPFYLLTLYCFARSSQRLHNWFTGTRLYEKYLASYVKERGLTWKVKGGIMLSVSIQISIALVIMLLKRVYLSCIILAAVWLGLMAFFAWGIRTLPSGDSRSQEEKDYLDRAA